MFIQLYIKVHMHDIKIQYRTINLGHCLGLGLEKTFVYVTATANWQLCGRGLTGYSLLLNVT